MRNLVLLNLLNEFGSKQIRCEFLIFKLNESNQFYIH